MARGTNWRRGVRVGVGVRGRVGVGVREPEWRLGLVPVYNDSAF